MEQASADKKKGTVSEPAMYCPQEWFCGDFLDPYKMHKMPDIPMHALALGIRSHILAEIDETISHGDQYN